MVRDDRVNRGGPILLLALYVPPLITLADTDVRTTKTARTAYGIAMCALWGTVWLGALLIPDGGDAPPYGSALTIWTHGALSPDASWSLLRAPLAIAVSGVVVAIVLALIGVAAEPRSEVEVPAARRPRPRPRPRTVTLACWAGWASIALQIVVVTQEVSYDLRIPGSIYGDAFWLVFTAAVVALECVLVARAPFGANGTRITLAVVAAFVVPYLIGTSGAGWATAGAGGLLLATAVLLFVPASNRFYAPPKSPPPPARPRTGDDPDDPRPPFRAAPPPDGD